LSPAPVSPAAPAAAAAQSPPAAPPAPPAPEPGVDVIAEARRMNSSEFAPPPSHFRAGHVAPRKLPRSSVVRQEGGVRVKPPSGATVRPPAGYDGLVLTSGGFHSREFYAFDARTGDLRWGLDLDDDGPSSPACADGTCVWNTESCTVFAVEARTGKLRWAWW